MKAEDSNEVAPPVKKRRWRKPPSPVRVAAPSTPSNNGSVSCGGELAANIRLLQPELMGVEELVSTLKDCHVPVDCNSSRQELIELFSKHVMPKPQRKRKRGSNEVDRFSVAKADEAKPMASQENSTTTGSQKPIKRKSLEPEVSPVKKKLFQRAEIKWP